jgi:hypothetical protein
VSYAHLLASIASTISDYRTGEIPTPTAAHVDRWISQFQPNVRQPMLEELDHILKQTYFSQARVVQWLGMLARAPNFVGTVPQSFWAGVNVLRLQTRGSSQTDMLALLASIVQTQFGVNLGASAAPLGPYLYLDDFLFTGNTAIGDLEKWIASAAPPHIDLHLVVVAVHTYGEYYVDKKLKAAAKQAGKTLSLKIWRSGAFEDRKWFINSSEVFRPTVAAGDPYVDAYVAQLNAQKWPPALRAAGAMPSTGIFRSAATRDVLEWELLCAGARLIAQCANPKRVMRPLGFSTMPTLGFGAHVVTFRNCPNNVPLALWWGDSTATTGALAWYPLLPRRQATQVLLWQPMSTGSVSVPQNANPALPAPASQFRDFHEPPDVDAMPWEVDAEAAVEHAVDALEFDYDDSTIRVARDRGWSRIKSLDELRSYLEEAYNEAWYANVPFEGGEAVFEGDADFAVENALERIASELERLGWDV